MMDEVLIYLIETAPALRQVVLQGSYSGDSIRLLLNPWSQITHFYDMVRSESVASYVSLSSLPSLSYLYINKDMFQTSESAWIISPAFRDPSTHPYYEPVTLWSSCFEDPRSLQWRYRFFWTPWRYQLLKSSKFLFRDHSFLTLFPCSLDLTNLLDCRSSLSAPSHFKQEKWVPCSTSFLSSLN